MAQPSLDRLQVFLGELFQHAGEPMQDGSARLNVRLSVQEIGSAIGVGREQATRLLQHLLKTGFVRRQGHRWCLPPNSPIRKLLH